MKKLCHALYYPKQFQLHPGSFKQWRHKSNNFSICTVENETVNKVELGFFICFLHTFWIYHPIWCGISSIIQEIARLSQFWDPDKSYNWRSCGVQICTTDPSWNTYNYSVPKRTLPKAVQTQELTAFNKSNQATSPQDSSPLSHHTNTQLITVIQL